MDNFEKHIQAHQNQFDEHQADKAAIWAKIESELDAPKVVPLWRSGGFKIAASMLLLVGLGIIIGFFALNGLVSEPTQLVDQELVDIDMHYKSLVSHQVKLVQNHPSLSKENKTEFLGFIDELDQEYELLRLEMSKNLDNEVVLEAIVKNYKKRIELIENLLNQINKSKTINEDYGYTL